MGENGTKLGNLESAQIGGNGTKLSKTGIEPTHKGEERKGCALLSLLWCV